MKRIIVQLCLLFLAVGYSQAQPVSRQEALQKAAAFLKARGRRVQPEELSLAYRGKSSKSGADTTYASCYVFNNDLHKGFTVISGDKRAAEVIAYSDSGAFTEKDMPEHVKYWMDNYSLQIDELEKTPVSQDPQPVSALPVAAAASGLQRTTITPLIKTRWDQRSPFSDLCPYYGDEQCLTGCVATAMAQLMYYHQWPQDFSTTVPGFRAEKISYSIPSLEPVLFNWEDMKTKYSWGEKDGDAVATLVEYCANSLKMNFHPRGSAAYTQSVAEALKKYFGYDSNVRYVRKEYDGFTNESWEQLIYNELAEGRPVVLSGQATNQIGGHAFVCDGYENGMFHINWGWGGRNDGYFRMNIMNPQGVEGSGGFDNSGGYGRDQEAIIGIQPPADKILENTAYLTSLFTTSKDSKITANYYNQNDRKRFFRYGLGVLESNGEIKPIQTFRTREPLDKNQPLKGCEFDIKKLLTTPGKYRVVPISRQENHQNWRPGRSYADVTVGKNGSYNIRRHNRLALRVTRIALTSKRKVGVRQKFKVSLSNEFDNYKGNLYLFASADADKHGAARTMTRVSVNGGESSVADLSFLPTREGHYYLWITTDKKGDRVIGKMQMDIDK